MLSRKKKTDSMRYHRKRQLTCGITEKKTDSMRSQGENISHRINNITSHQDFD